MPVLTVIAGPNGSGKSTFTGRMDFAGRGNLLDPDAVARNINAPNPREAAISAARFVLTRTRDYARSLANLAEAIRLADIAEVYDNSGEGHRAVLLARAGVIVWRTTSLPRWAEF